MGCDDLFKKRKARLSRDGRPTMKVRDSVLICCEGERTEPNYFNGFRLPNVKVFGLGYNTDSLVEKAVEIKNKAEKDGEPYDKAWCVFDRDSFPVKNYSDAFSIAKKNKISVIFSNEAFELWYLLHFCFCDSALSREQYGDKISQFIGEKYTKNNPEMYNLLLDKQIDAIINSKEILTRAQGQPIHNPSLNVFVLVEYLNQWVR